MYEFIEVNRQAITNISSYAIALNGQILEEAIPDFKTLVVSGREALGNELTIDTPVGLTGAVLTDTAIPPRYIDVKYQISSKTETDLKASFQKLEYLLYDYRKEENIFAFADEPSLEYEGLLLDNEILTENNQLTIKGILKFICLNPYKMSQEKMFLIGLGQGEDHKIADGWYIIDKDEREGNYPIQIERINVFNQDNKEVKISTYTPKAYDGVTIGNINTLPDDTKSVIITTTYEGITPTRFMDIEINMKTCQITNPKNKDIIYNQSLEPGTSFDLRLKKNSIIILDKPYDTQVVIFYKELIL